MRYPVVKIKLGSNKKNAFSSFYEDPSLDKSCDGSNNCWIPYQQRLGDDLLSLKHLNKQTDEEDKENSKIEPCKMFQLVLSKCSDCF